MLASDYAHLVEGEEGGVREWGMLGIFGMFLGGRHWRMREIDVWVLSGVSVPTGKESIVALGDVHKATRLPLSAKG